MLWKLVAIGGGMPRFDLSLEGDLSAAQDQASKWADENPTRKVGLVYQGGRKDRNAGYILTRELSPQTPGGWRPVRLVPDKGAWTWSNARTVLEALRGSSARQDQLQLTA